MGQVNYTRRDGHDRGCRRPFFQAGQMVTSCWCTRLVIDNGDVANVLNRTGRHV